MPEMKKGKVKKLARIASANLEKRRLQEQRAAAQKTDLLENYAAFRKFERAGVHAALEGLRGEDLAETDIDACMALQKKNCGGDSEDFDAETSRAALVHPESRVLLMRPLAKEDRTVEPEPCSTGEAASASNEDDESEWDLLPEVAHLFQACSSKASPTAEEPSAETSEAAGQAELPIIGYLHLQFCVSNGPPLLCVLNMQLQPAIMGKGLGKFALQLVEVRCQIWREALRQKPLEAQRRTPLHCNASCPSHATALPRALQQASPACRTPA